MWKRAIIGQIYKKKREKADPANYKLVSIGFSIGKLHKIIMNKQLNNHLKKHLLTMKHGFTSGLSVTTNLLVADIIISNYVEDCSSL